MKLPFLGASPAMAAFNLAALAERPGLGHLVSREARDLAARFLSDKPRFRFWLDLINRRGFHRWFERFESLTVPGMALHQALRKLALEEAVIHALEAGMEQIVILGGGLDSLGARLARRYPEARFLEVDAPSVLASKRRVLEQSGFLSRNLSLIPMDLKRADLRTALPSLPGFRNGQPVFLLCEGALMHLERRGAEKWLADLAALPCPALRLAFTFMEPDADGVPGFRGSTLLSAWLRLRGQRFGWGMPARELGAFLARHGFALEEVADAGVFRSRFLPGARAMALAEGEKVAIASLMRR
jgi:methyltransferase (TIGR00027 family)